MKILLQNLTYKFSGFLVAITLEKTISPKFDMAQIFNISYLRRDSIKKHCENREKLLREHVIGCQGVKMFLVKDHFKVFFDQPTDS